MAGTTEGFRDALDRLANDPELRDRLSANAEATAAAHGLNRVGQRLVAIYQDLGRGVAPSDAGRPVTDPPSDADDGFTSH